MADLEKFKETVKVVEKTEKVSSKNTLYYSIKNEKGLVFNIDKEKADSSTDKLVLGETFEMEGKVLPPKEGYNHGSRWVHKFHKVGSAPKPTTTSTSTTKTTHQSEPSKPVIEGWRSGQAFNAGVLMAGYAGANVDDPAFFKIVFKYADQALAATYLYEKGAGTFSDKNEEEIPF